MYSTSYSYTVFMTCRPFVQYLHFFRALVLADSVVHCTTKQGNIHWNIFPFDCGCAIVPPVYSSRNVRFLIEGISRLHYTKTRMQYRNLTYILFMQLWKYFFIFSHKVFTGVLEFRNIVTIFGLISILKSRQCFLN